MKKILLLILALIIIVVGYSVWSDEDTRPESAVENESSSEEVVEAEPQITPISHATFVLNWEGTVIYNDPIGGAEAFAAQPPADIILLSDIHEDHLSVETLEAVAGDATIYAPQAVYDELTEALQAQTIIISNGETLTAGPLTLTALPMYNLPDQGVEIRHEKGRGNGYLIEAERTRVYIAGDTADIPEMRALTNIDIAFVPMNLPYTMSVEDAADGVLAFAPEKVYPYHYRTPEGIADVERFRELVNAGNRDIEVVLLDWYEE